MAALLFLLTAEPSAWFWAVLKKIGMCTGAKKIEHAAKEFKSLANQNQRESTPAEEVPRER